MSQEVQVGMFDKSVDDQIVSLGVPWKKLTAEGC